MLAGTSSAEVVRRSDKNLSRWTASLREESNDSLSRRYAQSLALSPFSSKTESMVVRAAEGSLPVLGYLWVRGDALIVLHGVLVWMTWAVLANVGIGTNHFRWLAPIITF